MCVWGGVVCYDLGYQCHVECTELANGRAQPCVRRTTTAEREGAPLALVQQVCVCVCQCVCVCCVCTRAHMAHTNMV